MMTKNNITFLITIFNPKNTEIDYIKFLYKKLKDNKIDVHLLIDFPDFNLEKLKFAEEKDVFLNKINEGKLNIVYKHIKLGNVKTSHFKTFDPDDYISINRLLNFSAPNYYGMIRMKACLSNNGDILTQEEVEKHFIYKNIINTKTHGTSSMILPTDGILIDKFYSPLGIVNMAEDQILANICYCNGFDFLDIEDCWYLYSFQNGITNKSNNNIFKYKKEMLESIKIVLNIRKKSHLSIQSSWPKYVFDSYKKNDGKMSDEENNFIINTTNELEPYFDANLFSRKLNQITFIFYLNFIDDNIVQKINNQLKKIDIPFFIFYTYNATAQKDLDDNFIEISNSRKIFIKINDLILNEKIITSFFKIFSTFNYLDFAKYINIYLEKTNKIYSLENENIYYYDYRSTIWPTFKTNEVITQIEKFNNENNRIIINDFIVGSALSINGVDICNANNLFEKVRGDIFEISDLENVNLIKNFKKYFNQTKTNFHFKKKWKYIKKKLKYSIPQKYSKDSIETNDPIETKDSIESLKIVHETAVKIDNKISFVSFLDINVIDTFIITYDSLKLQYKNYKYYVGVTEEIYDIVCSHLKYDKNVIVKIVDSEIERFNKGALFGNITLLTYCRFVIREIFEEYNNEPFIYIDVDVVFQKKIPEEYFEDNINYAVSNISKGGSNQSIKFWTGFFESRLKSIDDHDIKNRYKVVVEEIFKKIYSYNAFNAGIIIINNPKKYFELTEEILKDKLNILKYFDDQSLLNYYNNEHIKVVDDTRINFKIRKDVDFSKETSIIHFLGPNKFLMKRIYSDKWNFSILNRKKLLCLNVGLIVIMKQGEKPQIFSKEHSTDFYILEKIKNGYVFKYSTINKNEIFFKTVSDFIESVIVNKFILFLNVDEFNEFDYDVLERISYSTRDVAIPFLFIKKPKSDRKKDIKKFLNKTDILFPKSKFIFLTGDKKANKKTILDKDIEMHIAILNKKEKLYE